MKALLQLGHGSILATDSSTKFFKNALLFGFPIFSGTFFQYTIKFILRLPPTFFDGRNQVLLVCMSKVACDVRILKWLQRREGR